jgi:hypothetical protein
MSKRGEVIKEWRSPNWKTMEEPRRTVVKTTRRNISHWRFLDRK